jgi:medium-chain acyl-[acyl-carrier-protein] hydrolase
MTIWTQSQVKPRTWIPSYRPTTQASLRLFCFPYSGASSIIYYPWQKILPDCIDVCPIELPGHGTRLAEPLATDLAELVRLIAEGIQPFLDLPFALFGHSLGALLCFELSQFLGENFHVLPLRLFVSGHNAPQYAYAGPPIFALPDGEFAEKIRELNGTDDEVLDNPELRELVLPILRADFALSETYRYVERPPLDCPITCFSGLRDPYIVREELDDWHIHTRAAFSVRMFSGDHFFIRTDQSSLLRVLAQELISVAEAPSFGLQKGRFG